MTDPRASRRRSRRCSDRRRRGASRRRHAGGRLGIAAPPARPRQLRARGRRGRDVRRRGAVHGVRTSRSSQPAGSRSTSPASSSTGSHRCRARVADGDFATIEASEAVRLFVERAQAHRRRLRAHQGERGRRRVGLPAPRRPSARDRAGGGRRRARSPCRRSRAISMQRFVLLSGGGTGAARTPPDVAVVIDWSYDLLDDPQRRAFAQTLGVLRRVDARRRRRRVRDRSGRRAPRRSH